jgi:hypothetical protein
VKELMLATASLTNPIEFDGGTGYEVQTDPFDAEQFSGGARRSWSAFQVSGDEATFEWRTRADHVLEASRAVAAGKSVRAVLRDPVVAAYVSDVADTFAGAGNPDIPDPDDEAAFARWVLGIVTWEDLLETEGSFSAYRYDDDTYLRDAAAALELPRWASAESASAGGPGSGYDAAYIVLQGGRTLDDLALWLSERATAKPKSARRAPRRNAPR